MEQKKMCVIFVDNTIKDFCKVKYKQNIADKKI